jgi:DNA (cytosine-5)-methyltransferase 1
MFSGIGGFEYGIQRAFDVQEERRRKETTQGIDGEGDRLHPISEQRTSITRDTDNEHSNGCFNQGQPHCIGYSEIDKYAIKVYERNYNGHKNYGDATKINPEELPDFDLLVGGFPCQAFSIAGKRRGFDDTRGTLFFDIARILAEKKPKHLVLENVKGLLSHDQGRTFQTILGVLADLGYRVEWQVLNSKDFGVPQNRERVFIVGHLGGEPRRKVFPITRDSSKNLKQLVGGSQGNRVYSTDGVSSTLASQAGGLGAKTGLYAIANTLDANYHKGNSISSTRHTPRTQVLQNSRIRRLTPKECERLQGFPDDWTAGESDTQRYKMCGNAVTTNVVTAVMEKLL